MYIQTLYTYLAQKTLNVVFLFSTLLRLSQIDLCEDCPLYFFTHIKIHQLSGYHFNVQEFSSLFKAVQNNSSYIDQTIQ